jgi:hypothetical protein
MTLSLLAPYDAMTPMTLKVTNWTWKVLPIALAGFGPYSAWETSGPGDGDLSPALCLALGEESARGPRLTR